MPLMRERPPDPPVDTGHEGDDAQLELMRAEAPLGIPRRWSHFLYAGEREVADRLAGVLAPAWEVDVRPTPDGSGFTVQATQTGVVVSILAVMRAREQMTALAAEHGAEYDGWRAWL